MDVDVLVQLHSCSSHIQFNLNFISIPILLTFSYKTIPIVTKCLYSIRVSTENNIFEIFDIFEIFEMFENSKETCENIVFDKQSKLRKFRKSFSIKHSKIRKFRKYRKYRKYYFDKNPSNPDQFGSGRLEINKYTSGRKMIAQNIENIF